MDIQRPIPNQKLRADWGRAVADALRAQGLDGPGVLRTPGGTSLPPVPPPGVRTRPPRRPWEVVAALDPEGGGWSLRVFAGLAVLDGKQLASPADAAGSDVESGLSYFDVGRDAFGGESGFLAVASDGHGGWTLRRKDYGVSAVSGREWRAIAWVDWPADAAPKIRQLDLGVVDLGLRGSSGGGSGGGGEDEGGEEDEEETTPPSNPPPCGNPLNADDDYNPLDDTEDDDYNPLNYEGEGGYTPTCEPRASA